MAVAVSGGRDSLALLHATCRAAQALGLSVAALHVHHGLQPAADHWLRTLRQRVARWRREQGWPVTLAWRRLPGAPAPGESVEAWARAGRHAALQAMAQAAGADLLLLAHHRRDQAETVLLQLLRGGGPAGLSAMPRLQRRDGVHWARPWLDQPRRAVEAYVQRHRLVPLEDPSNGDPRWARNRLRHQVWPALSQAFEQAEPALALAARRAQEARAVLDEVAAQDLSGCTVPSGQGRAADAVDDAHTAGTAETTETTETAGPADGRRSADHLDIAAWRRLSLPRQANALRAWWRQHTGRGLPQTLLERLLHELPVAGPAGLAERPSDPVCADPAANAVTLRWPACDGVQPWCARGLLRLRRVCGPEAGHAQTQAVALPLPLDDPVGPAAEAPGGCDLSCDGPHRLPGWPGTLWVQACDAGGLARSRLQAVWVRPRAGGEQFQRAPRSVARSLKKQFQAAAVPAWARQGPLLWDADGALLFVPGLGVDAQAWAAPGTPQCRLHWAPDDGPAGPAPSPGSGAAG